MTAPVGGVSLFLKDDIVFEPREDLLIDMDGVDSLSIEISKDQFQTNKSIIIATVHRPPDINLSSFVLKLNDFLQTIYNKNKYVFYVNDFHNMFLSYFYHPLISKPTRVFKNTESLLDNI